MSQKKHQPGCPCCGDPPPPSCCDGETEPNIIISGYTGGTPIWNSESCCWQRTFTRDNPDPIHSCCEQLAEYELKVDCVTDLYQFERVNFASGTLIGCPFPQERCCLKAPVKIATFESSEMVRQSNFFAVDIYVESLTVVWGKESLECPIGNEPVCRWFIKVVVNYRYVAAINSSLYGETKLTNTFLHSCFDWIGSPVDATSENCSPAEACDQVPPEIDEACNDTQPVGPVSCSEMDGRFCIQRIRFFDERPEGLINFASTDVLGSCEEPACNTSCMEYDQEVCIASPLNISPPHWCTNPPTVTSETTSYVMDQTQCESLDYIEPTECLASGIVCFPTTQCTSPISVSVKCEALEYPDYEDDLEACRFQTPLPYFSAGSGAYCLCYKPSNIFGTGPLEVVGKETNADCTTPAGCYTRLLCNGDVVACQFNFVGVQTASNDITVTVNCGLYTQYECCYTPDTISVSVAYP